MNNHADMVRVFIALDIPLSGKHLLTDIMGSLQQEISTGIRWVDPAGIHLTLKFLGDIKQGLVPDVMAAMVQACETATPFSLNLAGLGVFPNPRQPRVLWAGIDGDMKPLRSLQERVDAAVHGLGFSLERRDFKPHLTLGRVRNSVAQKRSSQIGSAIAYTTFKASDSWRVEEMHLVQSNLNPQGTTYTSMGAKPFRGDHG